MAQNPSRGRLGAVVFLIDMLERETLTGAPASAARTALCSSYREAARTDAARISLAEAISAADPARAEARLATLREALTGAAPAPPRRLIIPHEKRGPTPRARDGSGRFMKSAVDQATRSRTR